jgi:antirestriction protein ArdC
MPQSHAATKAHELPHWTKHECRLNRDFSGKRFGDEGYAREELAKLVLLSSAALLASRRSPERITRRTSGIGSRC